MKSIRDRLVKALKGYSRARISKDGVGTFNDVYVPLKAIARVEEFPPNRVEITNVAGSKLVLYKYGAYCIERASRVK